MTIGARAKGRVEREQARRELTQRDLGVIGIREVFAERVIFPLVAIVRVVHAHRDRALGDAQRRLDRFDQALARLVVVANHHTIDDRIDAVLLVPMQLEGILVVFLERIAQVDQLAVHACAHPALLEEVLERVLVVALLGAHHRGEDHHAGAIAEPGDVIDDLGCR